MLENYLNDAISLLEELVKITQVDIENIKNANHKDLYDHNKSKNELIKKFEITKSLLDKELIRLVKKHEGKELTDILSEDIKQRLSVLRSTLVCLHNKNKEYGKSVIVVKEFYDSLVKEMFGVSNSNSYASATLDPEQLCKLKV